MLLNISYLAKVGLLTSLLLTCIACFNALVDPFNLFSGPRIESFNQLKPEFHSHVRMAKAHHIRLKKPEVIMLGSSRAEYGLNPTHPGFLVPHNKRYNLALQSANIYEILRYLQHAHSIQPLKQVIIGLDFFMFNINKHNEIDFVEERLAPHKSAWFLDIFQALFTYDGLTASIVTLNKQKNTTAIQYNANGFRNDEHSWLSMQKKGGHRQAAIKNERYTFVSLDAFPYFSIAEKNLPSQSMQSFIDIITYCKQNKIDLRLFISPVHARKTQIIQHIGLWPTLESWKRGLVQQLASYAPETPLWDFSGYNEITTEPFPPINDTTTQMKWYWESSHYKKEAGDLILDIILNHSSKDRKIPLQFGVKLSPGNIEQHLYKQRTESEKFTLNNLDIVHEINTMIINSAPKRELLFQQHPDLIPLEYFQQPSKISAM